MKHIRHIHPYIKKEECNLAWVIFTLILFPGICWKSRQRHYCIPWIETANPSTLCKDYSNRLVRTYINANGAVWLQWYDKHITWSIAYLMAFIGRFVSLKKTSTGPLTYHDWLNFCPVHEDASRITPRVLTPPPGYLYSLFFTCLYPLLRTVIL